MGTFAKPVQLPTVEHVIRQRVGFQMMEEAMSKPGSGETPRGEVQRALQQPEKGTNHGEGGQHSGPEGDAKGQYAQSRHGATNDGVSSADPRVFSGKESGDATWPLQQDKGKKR